LDRSEKNSTFTEVLSSRARVGSRPAWVSTQQQLHEPGAGSGNNYDIMSTRYPSRIVCLTEETKRSTCSAKAIASSASRATRCGRPRHVTSRRYARSRRHCLHRAWRGGVSASGCLWPACKQFCVTASESDASPPCATVQQLQPFCADCGFFLTISGGGTVASRDDMDSRHPLQHGDVTDKVIGAFFDTYNELAGFPEFVLPSDGRSRFESGDWR
jgi:hypothetical protein